MQTAGGNPVRILGDEAGNNAAVGEVGEYIQATRAVGAAVALTSGVTSFLLQILLTTGEWDVSAVVDWLFAATTSYTTLQAGISITGGIPVQSGQQSNNGVAVAPDSVISLSTPAAVPGANPFTSNFGPARVTVPPGAAPIGVNLNCQAVFTVAALSAYGTIRARRVQ